MEVLYLSYNGLTEPLGQRQVLPYLLGLASRGWSYQVISFEKAETATVERVASTRERLSASGIRWQPLRYHRRPTVPATAYDAFVGLIVGLMSGRRIRLVHARSTIPAALARTLAPLLGAKWIFDVRGLVAQEYADGGHWSREGRLFRVTDRVEKKLLRRADGLVFLTERIRRDLLQEGATSADRPTAVIPCSVDGEAFRPQPQERQRLRHELALDDAPVLVYSGSLGSWYRFEEMLDFFVAARHTQPAMRFLVLTMNAAVARAAVGARGLDAAVVIRQVAPEQVPAHLAAADVGICFLGDNPSKRASSPTKYGEYLATGLPVVTNRWTGDAARLDGEPAWLLVDAFEPSAYAAAASRLPQLLADPEATRHDARALALREFSLESAVDRYDALYRRLVNVRPGEETR